MFRQFADAGIDQCQTEKKSSEFYSLHGSELPAQILRAKRYFEIPAKRLQSSRKIGKCKRTKKFWEHGNFILEIPVRQGDLHSNWNMMCFL